MKLSAVAISLVLLSGANEAFGYRVSPDGNPEIMRKVVEKALFQDVKPDQAIQEIMDAEPRAKCSVPPLRNQILGTEEVCTCDYWSRPDIHTLGNMGFGGAVHAAMAPLATKIIDVKAYGGRDVRKLIAQELRAHVDKSNSRVIDLCCGVGISTRALQHAFHDAEFLVGVDTSPEMISMADAITRHEVGVERAITRHLDGIGKALKGGLTSDVFDDLYENTFLGSSSKCKASYRLANAESTQFPMNTFDLATIMYGFHEVPKHGRSNIINEALRVLRPGGHLAILDICPTYQPSSHMLAGEPFVLEYQQNIDEQLAAFPGFFSSHRRVIVPGHVNLWLLSKNDSS